MPTIINTRKLLDRKTVTMVSPAPITNAANMILIESGGTDQAMIYLASATLAYLYDPHEDAYVTLPSPALGGTFGAGVCGRWHPLGPTGTPSSVAAGSIAAQSILTTTLTLLADLGPRNGNPYRIRINAGTGAGREFDIVSSTSGVNSRITINNAGVTLDATSSFVLLTGRFYIFNAGTLSATSFKFYDQALATWSAGSSVTGLPATWGTDGRLARTPSTASQFDRGQLTSATSTVLTNTSKSFAVNAFTGDTIRIVSGTGLNQVRRVVGNTVNTITVSVAFGVVPDATSLYIIEGFDANLSTGTNTTTTLNDTGRAWTVNSFANSQVRIVAGVGVGQIRIVASNTATALTVSVAWVTTPDATSVYVLEGNDDALYLLGNNAVAMYKYSISGNTWATLAPVAARAGAPAAGANLNWIFGVNAIDWTDITAIKNGRFLYSFRAGATGTLDIYDIGLNTWVSAVAYGRAGETFTTGSGYAYDGVNRLYVLKEATGRMFAFNLATSSLDPVLTNVYPQSAVTLGDKMAVAKYSDGGTNVTMLYMLRHSGTEFHRCIMI